MTIREHTHADGSIVPGAECAIPYCTPDDAVREGLLKRERVHESCRRERDELRAAYQEQVEHNRFAANKHSEHIHELGDRLNDLRAEIERLRAELASDDEARHARNLEFHMALSEIERLRALVQEHITVHRCLVCGSELDRPKSWKNDQT